MESNTAALVKILDSLEKQERMVKAMLEDRKRQLKDKGRAQPGLEQLTASTAQVQHHATHPVILATSVARNIRSIFSQGTSWPSCIAPGLEASCGGHSSI